MIQANIKAATAALDALQAHPMAARVERTAQHLTVLFPPGYRLDGVRVSMANGILWACQKAIEKMETTWQNK